MAFPGLTGEISRKEGSMTISVKLTDPEEKRLAQTASRLQVTPEELAAAAVRDLVGRQDPEFADAAARILDKNRELYERLS
jgi:predicted transcriptional regulator